MTKTNMSKNENTNLLHIVLCNGQLDLKYRKLESSKELYLSFMLHFAH